MIFPELDIYYPGLNFVSRERLDPLLYSLFSLFGSQDSQQWYLIGQLMILFAGTYGLYCVLGAQKKDGILGALSVVFGILFILGADPSLLRFHWFPGFLAALLFLHWSGGWSAVFVAVLIGAEWLMSSGSLAVFGTVVALVGCALLRNPEKGRGEEQGITQGCVLFIGGLVVLLGLLLTPGYPMPDYPGAARVAPISPFQIYEKPLIGAYLNPNPIIHSIYLQAVQETSLRFLLLSAVSCVLVFFFSQTKDRSVIPPLVVLLIALLISGGEWFSGNALGMYAPFPSLSRVIPGLAISGLPWLILPFGLVLGMALISLCIKTLGSIVLLGLVLALFLVFPSPFAHLGFSGRDHFAARDEVRDGDLLVRIRNSPSAYVLDTYGLWVAAEGVSQRRDFDTLVRLVPGEDLDWAVHARPHTEEAALAVDGNSGTRWRTGRPQEPGDFFDLSFSKPVRIIRVVLSVRAAPTDFPRGIEVSGGLSENQLETIFSQPDWLGPVRWTPSGYPYFGPQSEVVLDFSKEEEVKYLKFTQLGKSDHFDWSINEIKLYQLPREK